MNAKRRLGTTDVEVTALSLGTAPIAGLFQPVGDEQAVATVQRAWDLGIRFFDTAPLYGLGLAERRLGAALAGRRRDDYVVATKVGRLLRPAPAATGRPDWLNIWSEWKPGDPVAVYDFSHDGVFPVATSSAIVTPAIGVALKPHVPQPVST